MFLVLRHKMLVNRTNLHQFTIIMNNYNYGLLPHAITDNIVVGLDEYLLNINPVVRMHESHKLCWC